MKILLPYLEFLHNFRPNVLTFVELYPFGTIRSIKEDNVMKKYGEKLLETLKKDCMLSPNHKVFI
jgi:hypothetical protein